MSRLKDELKSAGKDAAAETGKTILGAIIGYFRREKPLRTWLRRRRVPLTREELEAEAMRRADKITKEVDRSRK